MKSLGSQIKDARQKRHLSQSALAQKVGCKQSALSMFEGGRVSALSAGTIGKICDLLGLLPPTEGELTTPPVATTTHRCFCPNPECISNLPIQMGDKKVYLPHRNTVEEGEVHCKWCGEVLERTCPECGEKVNAGAFCSHCGTPYLAFVPKRIDPRQVDQYEKLLAWSE